MITLEEAINLALAHNHALLATRTTILQNQAQEITANLRPNPTLDFDAQFVPILFAVRFFCRQPEFGAAVRSRHWLSVRARRQAAAPLQAARDQTAVTRAQVTDAERNLIFNVSQQFVAVLLAESTLRFAELDLKSFQQTVDIFRDPIQGGIHQRRRLPEDQAAIAAIPDRCFLGAAGAGAGAGQRCASCWGMTPFPPITMWSAIWPISRSPATLDDLQAKALQLRPDYRAAELSVTAAQSQIALAKANGKQDVTPRSYYTPRRRPEQRLRSS